MTEPLHVVFCVDRKVLPGLHVAAYSLLENLDATEADASFHVFSEDFTDEDMQLLDATLARTGKAYTLDRRRIDPSRFAGFPLLNGSMATYYRLMAPQALGVERFLYVDADTLCDVNVAPLRSLHLGNAPAAWAPEAPLPGAVDRLVAEQLGNRADEYYFNAGVALVNVEEWNKQRVTEQAMEYLSANHARFHDQSALNWVLHRSALHLDGRYNFITNKRTSWPGLRKPVGSIERLIHFVDSPKPWDFLGEFVHPQYPLWRKVLDKTALAKFRSWQATPARKLALNSVALHNYQKALKDRLLFSAYRRGWLRKVKGVPEPASV